MTLQEPTDGSTGGRGLLLSPRTWRPWSRRVAVRSAMLVGAYLFWLGYLLVATRVQWTSSSSTGSGLQVVPPQSMYQEEPGITRTIFTLAAVALLIETASILWRAARHSTRPGVTGLIVAGLGGAVALLGILTIGPFIVPFVAICVFLALPINERPVQPPPPLVPPGWYGDPTGRPQWRFWDGWAWTTFVATCDRGVDHPLT